MTTTYGTISTLEQTIVRSGGFLATRRPWKEMMTSLSLPGSPSMAVSRIKANISYFHANYAIVVLSVIFLSLLWQPMSLIVFIFVVGAWLYFYFMREEPVVVLGYVVDERAVLVALSILTTVVLLTMATGNVAAALALGGVAVAVHGAVRSDPTPEMDPEQGLIGVGSRLPPKVGLIETIS